VTAPPRLRVGRGAVVVLLLVALGIAVLVSSFSSRGGSSTEVAPVVTAAAGEDLYVHVLGAVRAPGLYRLRTGDRVVDAVAAAGGFAEGADESQLNLARELGDGEQLVVPLIGDTPVEPGGVTNGLVNLNTADSATLDTLPRIGPAMAQRIIDWREANGRFSVVDDLLEVAGVGEATLEGLRDLVTV